MNRGNRLPYVLLAVYGTHRLWLPLDPIAWAPPGDVFLLAGLLISLRWFIRGLVMPPEEEW